MIDWDELRELHLGDCEGTYLNSAANGLPNVANEAFVANEIEKFRRSPGKYRMDFIANAVPAIKQQAAKLINAKNDEIALVQNLSIALNLFVKSLPTTTKVAFYKGDYPSLTKPFEIANFNVCWLEFENGTINLDTLEIFLQEERPDMLGISHVQWLSGYKADLELIGILCKQYHCTFLVDATQSLGAMPIDVDRAYVDILGASGYKWPLAGYGNGIFYINKKTLEAYPPRSGGFNSYVWENGEPIYYPSIRSYEPGHHDHVAFHRLGFAFAQLEELGLETIELRIRHLMSYLIQELQEAEIPLSNHFEMQNVAGILCIKSHKGLFSHLISKGIEVSERGGNIRLGLHYYNNESDIDVFVKEVTTFLS